MYFLKFKAKYFRGLFRIFDFSSRGGVSVCEQAFVVVKHLIDWWKQTLTPFHKK